MSVVIYATCPACEWRSRAFGGGNGRMMGVCTAGAQAEDEFDSHYQAEHDEFCTLCDRTYFGARCPGSEDGKHNVSRRREHVGSSKDDKQGGDA